MDVVQAVEDDFGVATVQVVSLPDLYGGKLCAALDRQHPRDLFDVKLLLDQGGLNRTVFEGFLVYLLGHPRPLGEMIRPRLKSLANIYQQELDRKSTRLNSSHVAISYAVFCLKKKKSELI